MVIRLEAGLNEILWFEIFLRSRASRAATRPTFLPVQWVLRASS